MSKFSKHIGQGEIIEIDGDEFILKPLTTEHLSYFFKALKSFSAAGDEKSTIADVLQGLDDEGMGAIRQLIEETLKNSYPEEWKENPEELKSFGLKYMGTLIAKIFEINSAQPTAEVGARKKAEEMARLKALKANATPTGPGSA